VTRDVCVVGSINVDTTYRVSRLPVYGETVLAGQRTLAPGGKGANQAAAAASVGGRVSLFGCTGSDAEARIALQSLTKLGVDVSEVRAIPDAPTGTAIVMVADDGENVIVVYPGANQRLSPGLVARHLSSGAYAVVIAQLEINLDAVLSAAKSSGTATFILNPAPMPSDPAVLSEILKHTDVLVPNRLELGRLARRDTPVDTSSLDRCVAELAFDGPVLVTLGRAGVAVYERGSGQRSTIIEPVLVNTIDTTGAGDAFCGAFGHFLSLDGDVIAAARRANETAAFSTTVRGAQLH
jgi:ribokinase